jgi:hypothetical protein
MIRSMMRERRRWRTLVPQALAVGLLYGASREAAGGVIGNDRWNWTAMAFYVVAWALVMPLIWWLARPLLERGWVTPHPARRNRDRAAAIVAPVLRSGVLPNDIDRRAWRRAMRDTKQALEGALGGWFAINVVVAGLTGASAIVANHNAWTVWAVAVVVAAQGAVALRLIGPRLRTARRLLAELSDSDATRRP